MVYAFSPVGALGVLVRVEVDIRNGLPGTDIVGLPSSEVREARDRVRVALRNAGYHYPTSRILVNLSPAEEPKLGSGFDLPIALAILERSGQISLPAPCLSSGELSVNGEIIPVRGTLSAVLAAEDNRIPSVLLGERALRRIPRLSDCSTSLYAVPGLAELRGVPWPSVTVPRHEEPSASSAGPTSFDDIDGQPAVKWAATVAAAGFHNLLLMGPPGSAKTMAAQRIRSLHPPLDPADRREVARIYSMRGLEELLSSSHPPLRMPHHSASLEGMLGGGRRALPGEVSLAHKGIMVLDEATEFRPAVLQALREPVERGNVTLSRAGRGNRFPARFQLILTSNLCPCGKLGKPHERCMCSGAEIERYWRRLGAALLDRVDIRVRTYYQPGPVSSPSHQELCDRVAHAVRLQQERAGGGPWTRNGLVPPEMIRELIPLSTALTATLRDAMQVHGLSDRAAAAVRCVARTLADLDDRGQVSVEDIQEAVALRSPAPV